MTMIVWPQVVVRMTIGQKGMPNGRQGRNGRSEACAKMDGRLAPKTRRWALKGAAAAR